MLTFRDALRDMEMLRREIERTFEDYGIGRWTFPFSRYSFVPAISARSYPLLNVSEDENALHVEALAPGVSPDSLKVAVTGNQLSISGEKAGLGKDIQAEAYHRNERSAGRFVRTLDLPADVDAGKVEAKYSNGLLRITLPKTEEAKPKQIAINVG